MKYSSACYNVIIEDSVQCYFSSRNQCKPLSMWYLPICPDASTLPFQKEKMLLCWQKATESTSVNTRGAGGKGAARKGKCTAKAKLTAAAELKTSYKARCALHSYERELGGLEEVTIFAIWVRIEELKV